MTRSILEDICKLSIFQPVAFARIGLWCQSLGGFKIMSTDLKCVAS